MEVQKYTQSLKYTKNEINGSVDLGGLYITPKGPYNYIDWKKLPNWRLECMSL